MVSVHDVTERSANLKRQSTNVLQTCRNEKHGLLPNSFCDNDAESTVGLGKMLYRFKAFYRRMDARFRISGHTKHD